MLFFDGRREEEGTLMECAMPSSEWERFDVRVGLRTRVIGGVAKASDITASIEGWMGELGVAGMSTYDPCGVTRPLAIDAGPPTKGDGGPAPTTGDDLTAAGMAMGEVEAKMDEARALSWWLDDAECEREGVWIASGFRATAEVRNGSSGAGRG